MRKDMKRKIDSLVALVGAVLCVCACLVGCERKAAVSPEPPAPAMTNAPKKVAARADDAAYQAQLKDHIAAQRSVNVAREKILARMEQLRERARKALPEGATDEQVKAELEGNPRKYPAWGELVAALAKNQEELENKKASAVAAIRRRVLREVAEQTSAKK
jgi:hypothetical protein